MRGIDFMNDDPSEVSILYGKVTCIDNDNFLQDMSDGIVNFFSKTGKNYCLF